MYVAPPSRLLLSLLLLIGFLTAHAQQDTRKINVPVNGSLSAAIASADRIATGPNAPKKIEIILAPGTYFIDSTIEIVQGKNWHAGIPLTIRSSGAAHAIIHGGRIVPVSKVQPVKDPYFLAGLEPQVRSRIRMLDLKSLGIKDMGRLRAVGFSRPFGVAWMEPFFNKVPGTIARWPNDSMILISKLIDSGAIARYGDYSLRGGVFTYEGTNRPSRWRNAANTWIAGYFMWGYADDAVPLKSIDTLEHKISTALPTMYGFGTGKPYRAFYAYNIPEEIDLPGEYYLDRDQQKLYFLPPAGLKTIELSVLEAPMMALEGVCNIRIYFPTHPEFHSR